VRGLVLTLDDEPGFWEAYGYHNRGEPWLEQRYQGDWGDELELRAPIGGYFIWEASQPRPLQLIAGGSGIVPLRAMRGEGRLTRSGRGGAPGVERVCRVVAGEPPGVACGFQIGGVRGHHGRPAPMFAP
jgi:hypothetical protein